MTQAPPQSTDAEEAVLCCAFLDPAKSLSLIEEMVSPEMFHSPACKSTLEAILALQGKGEPISLITVSAQLQQARKLDSVGGAGFLGKVYSAVPSASLLKAYLEIVKDTFHKRQILRSCHSLEEMVHGDPDELTEGIQGMEKAIAGWKDSSVSDDGPTNKGWIDLIDIIDRRGDLSRQGKVEGIATSLPTFNRVTGGLQKGTLYVIGATPNVGKSLLVSGFIETAAINEGIKSAVFSLEMRKQKYHERLLVQSRAAGSGEIKCGLIKESSQPKITTAMGILREKVFIDDSPCITVAMIISRLKRHFLKHPDTGIVAIDYLQLIQPAASGKKGFNNREQEVNQMVRDVDSIKKIFDVPVLLITSLNRKPEERKDRRPRLSDSRDSGQIEFQADVGLLLHFPDSDESFKKGSIIIDKQRDGETRDIEAVFHKQWLRFEEPERP